MKTQPTVILLAALLLAPLAALRAAEFHVAPNGGDGNPGTETKPFATLERARDAVRALRKTGALPQGGVSVAVHGGAYELARPLELTEQDSGSSEAPVIYLAKAGETVRIVGGKAVKPWQRVADAAVLQRLDPAARSQVWQADLRALGIADLGQMGGGFGMGGGPGLELFFNDQPMTLARYPNSGFIRIASVLGQTVRDVRGIKGFAEGILSCEDERVQRWVGEKDPWVLGYWFYDWAEQRQRVESIDAGRKIITLAKPDHGYGYRKGQWFYGFNLLAELDSPGEWYLDRETGVLYFWPPTAPEAGRAVVSLLPALVTLKQTSHVTFRGFTFEAARGKGFTISGGTGNTVAACVFRNLGEWAISASGSGHRVVGCDIYATGDGGISVTGGDRKTLEPGRIVVENNHVHDYSRWNRTYRSGIQLQGVGNRAAHNLIDNAPHMAMGFGGNDHVIEFNEIHSVCYESNDAGAIYCGRDWAARGHQIRHNYLHDISGHEGKGCVGIYLDDQFSSAHIFGNVFFRVTNAAFIGGGDDSTIENNIFVDCQPAVHVDARGLGWQSDFHTQLAKQLQALPFREEPWRSRYPGLLRVLDDPDRSAPKGNVIARNIQWKGKWDGIEKRAHPYLVFQNNVLDLDPGFVNEAGLDFRLKDDSMAYKIGFQKIPVEKIGLYADELRASWPVTHKVRSPPLPVGGKVKPASTPHPETQKP